MFSASDPWILSVTCGSCKALPGQLCKRRGGPFHAGRIDKGIALRNKERLKRLRELEDLV